MNRNTAFGLGALLGAAAALVWDRRTGRRPAMSPPQEAPQRELRQKLAEAQQAQVDEDDFGAAGMGAETLVEEAAPPRPPAPPASPQPEGAPAAPARPSGEPPPTDEFEAMRRRIHEEGQAAAEEMRRAPEAP